MPNSTDQGGGIPTPQEPEASEHPSWFRDQQYLNDLDAQNIELDEKAALSGVKVGMVRCVAWLIVLSIFLVAMVWFVHYLGPESLHWLSPPQIRVLERTFGGSGLGYLMFALARDYLPHLVAARRSSKN